MKIISRMKEAAVVGVISLGLLLCMWGLPWLMFGGWELVGGR